MKNTDAYNNYGSFNKAGDEYEIVNPHTPVPWCNILSNSHFGTVISTHGTVYSFYKNASEYKLTYWCNDWANFAPGEQFKGIFEKDYNLTYGFGYVKVTSETAAAKKSMDIFIPMDDDVKIQYINVTNKKSLKRQIVLEYKLDMVLGVAKEMTSRYVLTRNQDNMLLFKNPYSQYFSDVVSYLKVIMLDENGAADQGFTSEIMYNKENSSVIIKLDVEPEQTRKIAILFGATDKDYSIIQNIVEKYSDEQNVLKEYEATKAYWRQRVIRSFDTSDKYLNIMANGWLSYQAIACRLFARTALYQAGGAFGYRDQLQDSLALISTWPEFTRSQIIKHSTKQFAQGDVLHWWHEHNGAGIRTLFSDDYLWLPYVLSEYVEKTRDYSILDVRTPFLEDKPLNDRREIYDVFNSCNEVATVYQHALRAIQYGMSRKGRNGLLSIGDGDWCDGYSNIRGESVWVTLFMMDILQRFANIAAYRGDDVTKLHFLSDRNILKNTVMDVAYKDGYFIRAFYPDGTPLGAQASEDCKIDLIAQAWAAIALKDYPDCKEAIDSALRAAEKYLVDRDNNVIKLLYPPFDNPVHDPGYIKAYVPGVRENGGQYTHAAIWLAKAYFEIGEREKGLDILKIICPIYHSDNKQKADIYKVEPYVVAADVYATPEHIGRGGWTWYTGSAAWLYKVIEDSFEQVTNLPDEEFKEEVAPKKRGRKPKNVTT